MATTEKGADTFDPYIMAVQKCLSAVPRRLQSQHHPILLPLPEQLGTMDGASPMSGVLNNPGGATTPPPSGCDLQWESTGNRLSNLERGGKEHEKEIKGILNTVVGLSSEISNLKGEVSNLKKEVSNMKGELKIINTKIDLIINLLAYTSK